MGALPFKTEFYDEYRHYIESLGEDNHRQMSILKRNLRRAITSDITPKQWRAMELYYARGLKMSQVAQILGVSVSTVSRNIARGKRRLRRCLKYGAKELLGELDDGDI